MSIEIRQKVWDQVRALGRFTADDLTDVASRAAIQNYLHSWERSGAIRFDGKDGQRLLYIQIEQDETAPPVQARDGSPARRGRPADHMWTAARMLMSFTPRDLAAHSTTDEVQVSEDDARLFCAMLMRGSYLRVLRKAQPGKREARYKLVRNTGPRPPVEKRLRAIWDENTRSYTHIPGVEA